VATLVEAMRWKLRGHGFDSQWGQWNLFIGLVILAALWGLVLSQSRSKGGWSVGLTNVPPRVSGV
jgi:hypothetical protein